MVAALGLGQRYRRAEAVLPGPKTSVQLLPHGHPVPAQAGPQRSQLPGADLGVAGAGRISCRARPALEAGVTLPAESHS